MDERVRKIRDLCRSLNKKSPSNQILVADFTDTLQGKDTSKVHDVMADPNGNYIFRTKINSKRIDPLAARAYGKDHQRIEDMTDEEIEDFINREEFDFSLWFKNEPGFDIRRAKDYNGPIIIQVGGCNFNCRFCFVDDKSKDGERCPGKVFLSVNDAIEGFMSARKKIRDHYASEGYDIDPKVFRVSGGEPSLVLRWIVDLWKEIIKRGLDVVGQVDTNLSTVILPANDKYWSKLARYPVKILAGIKGVSTENIAENSAGDILTIEEQTIALKKLVSFGLDVYPQVYNPDPKFLQNWLIDMDSEIENFSLRVHIGPLKIYPLVEDRLERQFSKEYINSGNMNADEIIAWAESGQIKKDIKKHIDSVTKQWNDRYEESIIIMDQYLLDRYGKHYRSVTRSDVKLLPVVISSDTESAD